jgi:plasmid stability protein
MAQILVRDVEKGMLERLKAQARRHGRSLQGEVKVILIEATGLSLREAGIVSTQWQKRLADRAFSDSANLIREDRSR